MKTSAGYSGKPAWQKLGLREGLRVHLAGAPAGYDTLVGATPAAFARVGPRAAFDLAHLFVTRRAALERGVHALARRLPADGVLWISWPKRSAGVDTDVVEDTIREVALPLGLVDVKVCAIDATWSALKLVWRRESRAARSPT